MFLYKKKHLAKLITAICVGLLTGLSVNALAADENNSSDQSNSAQGVKKNPKFNAKKSSDSTAATNTNDQADESLTVYATANQHQAGSSSTLSASDMQKNGGNDFGSIMRYQPLVSATGSSAGSSAGKSGFDRSGYTGYNIRGMESNRVSLDVDDIPLPNATGRSYVSRAGQDTFGIGRDYMDPYMYGQVNIESGATSTSKANSAIGGAVSFMPKSADDYLSGDKDTYFGYQSDYDSSNRSWHNGITAAAGDETLRAVVVVSRRDGQQTRNNSGTLSAYPENWHSNAVSTSVIWQPNEQHVLTGTLDYYDKTSHSNYDVWDSSGNTIAGPAQQQSESRRASFTLRDSWTPTDNWLVDAVDSRLFYQNTQAHDRTYMPSDLGTMETVYSDYNVNTYGFESKMQKELSNHKLSWGLNGLVSKTERPFRQDPPAGPYDTIMQPEADSRTITLGGFVQDDIGFDLGGHAFSVVPGVRTTYQQTKPQNLSSLASGVVGSSQIDTLYGKTTSDTQVLPSLSFLYDITPGLTTYLQYKRGAEFPDASQLYGSWNLGSNYAGSQQYAFIGNTDLKTETSDNFEWGLKGTVTPGVSFNAALFYNTYKNFIANTRYTRNGSPGVFTNVPSNIYTVYRAENRDKAFIYGTEISSKINFGTWFSELNGLSAKLAFGYNQGEAKSSYQGDKYVDLDSVAPMKAVIGLAWDDPSNVYGAAVTSTFQKGKQATATNRQTYSNTGAPLSDSTVEYQRVPGYGLVDLTAYWRATPHVKLSGGIYNVTDRKYWDYLSSRDLTDVTKQDAANIALAAEPGRTFQLGVNVDF